MKLRINPLVVADLKAIKDYTAEDNAEAARKTVDEIYKSFENLQQFPTMGADLSKLVSLDVYKRQIRFGPPPRIMIFGLSVLTGFLSGAL